MHREKSSNLGESNAAIKEVHILDSQGGRSVEWFLQKGLEGK